MPAIPTEHPFVSSVPSPQNAIDLFAGEWASRFPPDGPSLNAGTVGLFEDPRIRWADDALREVSGAGFAEQSVLELGPLEGGHTYMLSRMGAKEIVAVEANARSFLRCLVAKELVDIPRSRFLLGDAVAYLRTVDRHFDVGFACGFLYHLAEPMEVIALLARCCQKVFICTAIFDESLFVKQPELIPTFGPPRANEFGGFRHTLFPHTYANKGREYRNFLGGIQPGCSWMRGSEIVAGLRHFGFTKMISHEEDNPYGKTLSAVAMKA